MIIRKKNKSKAAIDVPVHLRDRLNVIVAVVQTVCAALTEDEQNEPLAVTLLEHAIVPLRRIRDVVDR